LAAVAEAENGDLNTRILDAALVQFETFGVRRATMQDVAHRARLARKTLYRRFANKDALVEAVILRELARGLAEIEVATAGLATVGERLVEGFVVALRAARRHPLLNRLLTSEPDALPYLTTEAGSALGVIHGFLVNGIRSAHDPGSDPAFDVEIVAEGLLRFAHSYMLTRRIALPLNDDKQVRAFAWRYLTAVSGLSLPSGPS
jgi:AcrR family transcriptional regulator